mgnify:CR=1 FL=1
MKTRQIAIDGVSSSGKTTVGKIVAERLGYEFIDSGLLYRLATKIVLDRELPKEKYAEALLGASIDIVNGKVLLNEKEVPIEELRSKEVDELVSPVSEDPKVREEITDLLRQIASSKNVVMVGRDIGSVVLKDAFLKVFLTATLEERANRRFKELFLRGENITFEEVYENLKKRDIIDSTREFAPLKVPEDAYVVDTTMLSIEEVVTLIFEFIKGKEYALRNSQNYSDTLF